jgi:peptidyl-prolyl cis-trans isomerase B (cyclophilin B)
LEIKLKGEPQPRYNTPLDQPALSRDLALPHRLGAVAMARSSAPDSATSQFYISLSALPILDGRFAVFGYVTEGMALVDQIEVGDVIESAWIRSGADHLVYPEPDPQETPVVSPPPSP